MADRVVDMDRPPPTDDICHPLASLKWSKCRRMPLGMRHAQAVWPEDKLYVGGGVTSGNDAKLYIYTHSTDTWSEMNTPVYYFALITYLSELMLVGGREHDNGLVTNKLWTLTSHDQWREILLPMTVKRCGASAVEYAKNIIVAGGDDDSERYIDIVEVYNGHHWTKAQCLPNPCERMKSTVLSGHWYLMGGYGPGTEVYCTSLASLVVSCQLSEKPLPSVWKRLTDVPHVRSSPAVFGNRLIAVGGIDPLTSSIHAYSPHTQSWIHVGDMPVGHHSTCTIVLPTGRLMVIGGRNETMLCQPCVYQATLNVASFESDNQFTMEVLSRLEEIGVIIFSKLEGCQQPLQSVIGIEIVNLPTELNSFSILEAWLQGHANLRPTWRHFFWALREIHLSHLADQIEYYISGTSAWSSNLDPTLESEEPEGMEEEDKGEEEFVKDLEDEKHIAAVQKAMQEKGMLDHTIVHGVFVGPARSGKNSLMERLLGRMPSSVSPSTGVAESVVHVEVIQKSTTLAANVVESFWSVMDYDDEAIKLMLINSDSQNKIEIRIPHTEEIISVDSEPGSLSRDGEETRNGKTVDSESEDETQTNLSSDSPNPPLQVKQSSTQSRSRLPDCYVPPIEIIKVALRKKGRQGLETLQQHFQKTWSLYLTNTGGQMEFQEVLPLLVSGPSMFFFTFRLDRDINQRYVIEYELSDGSKAKPYTSTLTILEGILQTLATIAAMGTFVYKGLQKCKVPLKPKVFIVGTHKDKLDSKTADEYIAKVDGQLQEAIQATSHHKDLIEFSSPSQLIFAVNNFSDDDSEFKNIRLAVERVVARDEFHMTSPAHWLIFSLALRKLNLYVVSYETCYEIAKQCGLGADEVQEALHFIHSKMGLIRYFPYEDVKDLVVIHPQVLFDKVTELIVDTFTFEKAGEYTMSEFKQKGIFSLSQFEQISSRSSAVIRPFQFAKLLEKLRIAAPFQMDGERKYFFPCVLAHATENALQHLMLTATPIPQLIVTFQCGYCPKGLAGALIKYLMANEMESCYPWEIFTDKIYRNQVSFHVGPLDTFILRITPTYLEIVCIPDNKIRDREQCPLSKVCCEVCQAVDAGIRQVTSDINYVNAQHLFTFRCECKGDHPGALRYLGTRPYLIWCSKTKTRYLLSPKHMYELWQVKKPQVHHDPKPPPFPKKSDTLSTCLNEADHHSILFEQLSKHSAEWRNIARHLGFTPSLLDIIEAKPLLFHQAPKGWLDEMLAQWLRTGGQLETLKNALWDAGLGQTASDLHV